MGPLGPDSSVSPTWAPHGFGQVPLHAWAWALGFVFLGIGPPPPPPLPVALYTPPPLPSPIPPPHGLSTYNSEVATLVVVAISDVATLWAIATELGSNEAI